MVFQNVSLAQKLWNLKGLLCEHKDIYLSSYLIQLGHPSWKKLKDFKESSKYLKKTQTKILQRLSEREFEPSSLHKIS